MAARLDDALSSEVDWGVIVGRHSAVAEALDGVAHLIDDGGAMFDLLLVDHLIEGVVLSVVVIEHVGGVASFGVEVIAHDRIGIFDRTTFRIDDVGEKREAMAGFVLRNVAGARGLDLLWCGDLNSGFALPGDPVASIRLRVEGDEGGDVGLHRLVFLEREGEYGKEDNER